MSVVGVNLKSPTSSESFPMISQAPGPGVEQVCAFDSTAHAQPVSYEHSLEKFGQLTRYLLFAVFTVLYMFNIASQLVWRYVPFKKCRY